MRDPLFGLWDEVREPFRVMPELRWNSSNAEQYVLKAIRKHVRTDFLGQPYQPNQKKKKPRGPRAKSKDRHARNVFEHRVQLILAFWRSSRREIMERT
jgi:hypothetical protein